MYQNNDKFKISVIIPTKNGMPYIRDCLSSIFNQQFTYKFEVICVDSGSVDGTLEVIKRYPVRLFTILPKDFNHGLTRNFAIDKANSEFVVILTQDAVPYGKYWLTKMVDNFSDELVAGVYCRQIPRKEDDIILKREMESFLTARRNKIISYIKSEKWYDSLNPIERFITCYFDNVCSCIRKSIWSKFHFPETNFAEDLMWSKTILEHGYKIVYEPNAKVIHSHNKSFKYKYLRYYMHYETLHKLFGIQQIDSFNIVIRETLKQSIGNIIFLFKNIKILFLSHFFYLLLKCILDPLIINCAQYKAIKNNI